MKKNLLISLALLVAGLVTAAEGYVTKSASGTTSAQVFFPAGNQPLRFTGVDVTSDTAGSLLSFHIGTASTTVVKSNNANSLITLKNTLASNNVVLLQNAAETVVLSQVATNTLSTNKLISFANPLPVAAAGGDVLRSRLATPYTVLAPAATNAAAFLVSSLAGLADSDALVFSRPGQALVKAAVSGVATNTRARVTLRQPLAHNLAISDTLTERTSTFFYLQAARAAGTNNLYVTNNSSVIAGDKLVLENAAGHIEVVEVDSTEGTTNLILTADLTIDLALYDKAHVLSGTVLSVIAPAAVGDTQILLSAATGLADGEVVVIAATDGVSRNVFSSTAANTIYTLTTASALGVLAVPGDAFYKLTNTYTVQFSAPLGTTSVICDTATNLTAGSAAIFLPAAGGAYPRTIANPIEDFAVSLLGFTNNIALPISAGDHIFLAGLTNSLAVGEATVRRDGAAIVAVERGRPVRAVITGTSACAINSLTGVYGP